MNKAWKAILIFIICFGLFNIFILFSQSANVQPAVNTVCEDAFFAKATLIKEETLLLGLENEKTKLYLNEGERVAKGQAALALLNQSSDTAVDAELSTINERIKNLEDSAKIHEDAVLLTEQIKEKNNQIIFYNSRGDLGAVSKLKNEILLLLDKKNAAVNEDNSALISELRARKAELEAKIFENQKSTVYAPVSGEIFIGTDGLEEVLTPSSVESLTIQSFKDALKKEKKADGYKIINNYTYYAAFLLDEEKVFGLSDENVRIRFPENSEHLVNATLVLKQEQDGEYLFVYKCTENIGLLLGEREVEAEIVKGVYEGFKIPMSAVKNKDGLTGVYIDSLGRVEFREIKIIYKTDTYVIAEPAGENPLALYDNIIID